MADEPVTIGELARLIERVEKAQREGFAQINSRLDAVVSMSLFNAERQRVDERFKNTEIRLDERLKDLAEDVAAEREERKVGDVQHKEQLDGMRKTQRWVATAIILPIAMALVSLVAAWGGRT